jgi:hypothetical protein
MRYPVILLIACLLVAAGTASARTWYVKQDGTGDATTIGAGIDSAHVGDTVMVSCGTYHEHGISIQSEVYLTSETGCADCVTIDADQLGQVFGAYHDSLAYIVGFTVAGGLAVEASGGGLSDYGSGLQVINCIFRNNHAHEAGGGVELFQSVSVFINCVFLDNYAYGMCLEPPYLGDGGGAYCAYGSPKFINCVFRGNRTGQFGFGGGVGAVGNCRPVFENCLFACNWTEDVGTGGGGLALSDSSFAELEHCTFYGNSSWTDTLGGGVLCRPKASASLDNCIIGFSENGRAISCEGELVPVLTCCDLYGNDDGDWVGRIADQYGVSGNISEDPLFCDPDDNDFYLSPGSPCLDAGECGTIGAYGECGVFAVTSVTDLECDRGSAVRITWQRIGFDTSGSDTLIDYYSVWRRGGTWECVDSVGALGEPTYATTCPTLCDSTEAGVCWSVFFVRAHCTGLGLEFDTPPDSGYSVDDIGPDWIDVTTGVLGNEGWARGFAWVDYDSDDDLDIFITNSDAEDRLFRNDSLTAGGFVDATPTILADPGDSRGAAWGDYDNDHDLDLYVSKNGANKLYRNNGNGNFVDVTTTPLDDSGMGWGVSWADYDNDGDVDLYLINDGPNKLFRNDSGGVFTDATSGPLGDGGFGLGVGWADYDNDGDQDVYVANYDGSNVLLENQGGGTFVDVTAPPLGITAQSAGVSWGDYDNDGDLDLFVANVGPNNLLRNEGGSFTDVTSYPLDDDIGTSRGSSGEWGDYDLDGDLDLYLLNRQRDNRLFSNEGDGVFTLDPGCGWPTPLADGLSGYGGGWADYDKDGDLDLYIANSYASLLGSDNKLIQNPLDSDRHWLEVALIGVISNSFGQGARVRVVAGGASQIREITGALGMLSQGQPTAWFGLNFESLVDTVEVTWPASGIVQTFTEVAGDQRLLIAEMDVTGVTDTKRPSVFKLYPNHPNPFSTVTAIRYDLPEPAQVELTVYDVSGRVVHRLVDHRLEMPGRHMVYWDGRNAKGRSVAPGVYFYELSAGPYTKIERMVLLR